MNVKLFTNNEESGSYNEGSQAEGNSEERENSEDMGIISGDDLTGSTLGDDSNESVTNIIVLDDYLKEETFLNSIDELKILLTDENEEYDISSFSLSPENNDLSIKSYTFSFEGVQIHLPAEYSELCTIQNGELINLSNADITFSCIIPSNISNYVFTSITIPRYQSTNYYRYKTLYGSPVSRVDYYKTNTSQLSSSTVTNTSSLTFSDSFDNSFTSFGLSEILLFCCFVFLGLQVLFRKR